MKLELLDQLACPLCKSKLELNNELKCTQCEQKFEIINGIPNFLPKDLFNKYNNELKDQDLYDEQNFYENMYSSLDGVDDGHCVVYGYDDIYEFMDTIPSGGSLLDVGCGAGHHSKDLAERGFNVTGIDISINGLNQAVKVNQASNQISEFVLGDIENLPFADNSYDVVFCGLIIHHFPKYQKLISELSRVCKSHIIAFEVNSYDLISYLRFNILNPIFGYENITKNQRTVSPVKLKEQLRKEGFGDSDIKYIDVSQALGRQSETIRAKVLRSYRTVAKYLLPYRYRFNKFIIKAKKE